MEAVVKVSKEQWFKVVCWVSVLLKVAELWEAVWHEHGQQCRHDTHGNTKHANTAAPRLDTGLGSNNTYTSARFKHRVSGRNSWFCIQLCNTWFEYQEQLKTHFWDCILYEIFRLRWEIRHWYFMSNWYALLVRVVFVHF